VSISEQLIYDEPTREWYQPGHYWVDSSMRCSVMGRFENDSTNNHWWKLKRSGAATRDVGSNWTAFSSGYETDGKRMKVICRLSSGIYHAYDGPLFAGHTDNSFSSEDFFSLPMGYSDEANLIAYGTTAIARVLPTNPISDLPTAVGELLSEGLPKVPGWDSIVGRRFTRHSVPDAYLANEFGVKPFLSDLSKFRHAVLDAEKLIAQYVKDAGKVIRRRYEFPVYNDFQTIVHPPTTGYEKYLGGPCSSQITGYLTSVLDGSPGEMTTIRTSTVKDWFSGAFTYYLPPVGDEWSNRLLRQEAELRHLYGGISVDTAWNLLPYSWAVDWFTNAGDLIHNLAAFARDGLVMPWGYIMESCQFRESRTVKGAVVGRAVNIDGVDTGGPAIPYSVPETTSVFTAKYLRRRRATPFGFGLNFDDLTGRQKAITAALLLK